MKKLSLVIGTANWSKSYGSAQSGLSENCIHKIKQEAERLGIKKLDSALAYANSREELEGPFKIQTKINSTSDEFGDVLKNLEHMNVNVIFLHDGVKIFKNPGLLERLFELKKRGILLGISVYFPEEIYSISDLIHNFDIIQFPFNLVDQRFHEVMHKLRELDWKGIFQSRSVFLQGYLLERNDYPASFGKIEERLENFKQEHNLKERIQQSLQFILDSEVDELVIGVNSEIHLTMIYNSLMFPSDSKTVNVNIASNDEHICVPFLWK